MIGKYPITIDYNDLIKGMSTSDNLPDGGFSPLTDNINLTVNPGVIYAPAATVDTSSVLAGNIIMTCEDIQKVGPEDRFFVSTTGKFFKINGTTMVLVDTDATRTYVMGKSDMAPYKGYVYGTSTTHIFEWIVSAGTITQNFFAFTSAQPTYVPHPVLQYQDYMWYADGNLLLRQTTLGGTPAVYLTLDANQVIVALGIDPSSGLMLISTTSTPNLSGSQPTTSKILQYDGIASQPQRITIVDEMVTSIYVLGGTVFMPYGKKLGYWNGSGVTYLRTFKNVTYDSESLIYKHKITNIGNTLFIADGSQILAYGEVMAGRKVFYPIYKNVPGGIATNIGTVCNLRGKLGYSYATAKFFTLDITSVADTSSADIWFNRVNFPRPVYIREVYVEFQDIITNNFDLGSLFIMGEDQNANVVDLLNNTGVSVYSLNKKVTFGGTKFRSIQPRLNISTLNKGIKRVVISYDVSE